MTKLTDIWYYWVFYTNNNSLYLLSHFQIVIRNEILVLFSFFFFSFSVIFIFLLASEEGLFSNRSVGQFVKYISVWFCIARVQASAAAKKNRGLAVLLGVSWEPRPRPIRGLVASLFCVKNSGVGRGDFVTLIRVIRRKAVQSQRIFPVVSQINAVAHNHNTTSRAWGKWLTSHKLHGWGGWVMAPWTWPSGDSVQAPCMKSRQI